MVEVVWLGLNLLIRVNVVLPVTLCCYCCLY